VSPVDAVQVVESDAVGAESTKALLDLGVQDLRTSAAGAAASAFVATTQRSGS